MVRSLWWCTPSGRAFEQSHREPLIIRHEKRCPLVFQLSPFNHDRCQVQFKSFSSVCSPTTSPGTLINEHELSNNRSSSRIAIPYRLTFTFNLTVRKSSCCILAITPHPCSFFHLRGSIEIRTISLLAEQRSTIKLCSGSS